MQYKFKVDVYKRNPYSGLLWSLAALLGLPAAFLLLQKLDHWSSPAPIAAPAETAAATAAPSLFSGEDAMTVVTNTEEPSAPRRPQIVREAPTGTCIFEGKALREGTPFANALILARVSTSEGARTRRTRTDADGSYRLEVPLNAKVSDSLEWTLEARTPELQPVILAGRRIYLGDPVVAIEQTLTF